MDRRKRRNMLTMMLSCGLVSLGYGIHGVTYSQWIYVRFEMDVLGANFSKLNQSAARDPCFRGNESGSPFRPQLTQAQANSAHFSVWTSVVALIPSCFVNLLLGIFADQIGRRFIFIIPLAGNVIRAAIVCAVAYWKLDLNLVLVAYAVNGLTGDYVAFLMAMYVYTADNTTQGKNRSFLMVVAQAVITVCYYLSQLATGYFIEALGYVWPLLTSLGVLSLGLVFIVFFLQETLNRSEVVKVSFNQGFRNIFSFYVHPPTNVMYKRKDFLFLVFIFFVYVISYGNSIDTIFLMNEPFCWGSRQIGYVKCGFGLAQSLLPVIVMKPLQKILRDEIVCVTCLASATLNYVIRAFASVDWQVYIASAAGFLESPVLPVVRAILSRMYHAEKRGSLFASLAVIETATLAASGAGLNELYAGTVGSWRGLTYFVLGCISFSTAVLLLIYTSLVSRRQASPSSVAVEEPGTHGTVNTSDSDCAEIG